MGGRSFYFYNNVLYVCDLYVPIHVHTFWLEVRRSLLEYGGGVFLEINIFVGKMGKINKWPQDMVEINILPTQEVEINII